MSRRRIDRVGRYQGALERRARLFRSLAAIFNGWWLGRLDHTDLARIDELFYEGRREQLHGAEVGYRDDAWNRSGLHSWEEAAVDAHFPVEGRIVVTAAGGGREVLALLGRGFDAVGFEAHPGLAEAGRLLLAEEGHPGRLKLVERDRFPEAGTADGVVVGWGSYHSIAGRDRRIAFLRGARAALRTGAPLLVSFFTWEDHRRELRLTAAAARVVRAARRAEPAELGDTLNPNFLHLFTRAEIEAELAAAGFDMAHFADQPYGHAVGVAR